MRTDTHVMGMTGSLRVHIDKSVSVGTGQLEQFSKVAACSLFTQPSAPEYLFLL
jgi:hypothetical protein